MTGTKADPMTHLATALLVAAGFTALAACSPSAPLAAATQADKARVEAVSLAWKQAYNAGDAAGVAALYAPGAVVSAPGEPALRDAASINAYFVAKVAEFSSAGLTVVDEPMGEVVASGDLAWQWKTFKVTDRSGAVVGAGKLVTLFQRRDGQWRIAGDTWNSDGTAAAPAASGVTPAGAAAR